MSKHLLVDPAAQEGLKTAEKSAQRMQVFNFVPELYADYYKQHGYAHVKNGVTAEFLQFARKTAQRLIDEQRDIKAFEIKNKKLQFLFDFPDGADYPRGVYETVARVAGLPIEKMTLCERHIKAYEDIAEKNPPPHKDRVASQLAVGIPLEVPEDSYLILYPDDHLTVNPYTSTALWRSSLDEKDLPENVLKDIEPVKIDTRPGDVILLRGSSIYHERVNPAHTVLLYLKFNAMRLDPVGEDPYTHEQRKKSFEILKTKSDVELLDSQIEVSPRLENITRLYTRLHWKEVLQARLWGEKEFTISEMELQLFRKVDGKKTVRQLMEELGIPDLEHVSAVPMIRRLGVLGGIDFLN